MLRNATCDITPRRRRVSADAKPAGKGRSARLVACLALAAAAPVDALEIEITEGWDSPTKIAVVPFGGPAPGGVDIAAVASADLARSGQFAALGSENMLSLPTVADEVYFRDWRQLGRDYLVIGRVSVASGTAADRIFALEYTLFDVRAGREAASGRLSFPAALARDAAHHIADDVYQAVTGVRGAFSTKILYVLVRDPASARTSYHLTVADADGHRERELFRSTEPILSTAWAPEGGRVAYVSFETGRSVIVVQDLTTGQRQRVAEYKGINGAPVFSPDGAKLAMSLSRDGNSEIYIRDLASGDLRRVTRQPNAIDTEPSWSPDGESLIFTSDRGGRPQIYRKDLKTAFVERLTFQGEYNARGRLLPDGRRLLYVHRREGRYHIAWQDIETDAPPILLTETALDESPSIAPNGMMMIYATRKGGLGVLGAVSIDGRARLTLPSRRGDVREPAWSPFLAGPNLQAPGA